jgi:zinc protease
VATLTPEAVQAEVKRHVSLARLDFAFVAQDAKGLAAQLASGKPSPIAYPSPKPADVLETDKAIIGFPLPIHPEAIQTAPADQFMAQ